MRLVKTNSQQSGNEKHDLERVEREAKEKLMAKRKLQVMNQEKDFEAETTLDTSEDESEEYDGEAEQGELKDTNTVPDTPKPPLANPSNHKNKTGKKYNTKSKRMSKKAEKRARKRKRRQQGQGEQATKKKKVGKGKHKQDRSPPADRKWV